MIYEDNKVKMPDFSNPEKVAYFDQLCEIFYKRNFGLASKTEIELLMFHFYMESLLKSNDPDGDIMNFSKCSDYRISKQLGIPQSKVRSLKVKKHLVYPHKYDWKKALASLINNATFDPISKMITLDIPDPNLYNDVQNYIEENGAYIVKKVNNRLMSMRSEYFINIILMDVDDATKASVNKRLKEHVKANEVFDENNVALSLLRGGVEIIDAINAVHDLINPTNAILNALINLIIK